MSLREKLNNNPQIATGGAVVVLLLCLMLIYCQFSGGSRSAKLLYFDLETNQVKLVDFKAGDTLATPLAGTQIYQVTIFSCTECKEIKDGMTLEELKAEGMFPGYVIRLPEAGVADPDLMSSNEIRLIDGPDTWVNADTERGGKLVQQAQSQCPDGAKPCSQKPRKQ